VQGYDRYAYVSNNPLRYTDPTGHRNCEEDGYNCPGDKYTFRDRIQYAARSAAQKWKVPSYVKSAAYENQNYVRCQWGPGCVLKLMGAALRQKEEITIAPSQGLQNLIDDSRLKEQVTDKIVASVKEDPRYGVEAFTRHRSIGNSVTFGDGEGNKFQDAFYSQTWYARAVKIDADIRVTETGEIHIVYAYEDKLDLRPDWNNEARTASGYNPTVSIIGPVWHDWIGASDQMIVHAYWHIVVK
jgi:hypothetical protein